MTAPPSPGPVRALVISLLVVVLAPAQSACAGPDGQPAVVSEVDITRYAGTWYEVARYPNRFQKTCAGDATATYTLRDDSSLDVVNQCREASGRIKFARGVARRAKPGDSWSRLEVRFAPGFTSFLPFVWGKYWILDLAPDYSYAVVGEPSRQYLWILARSPRLPDDVHARILARLASQGYDTTRLVPSGTSLPSPSARRPSGGGRAVTRLEGPGAYPVTLALAAAFAATPLERGSSRPVSGRAPGTAATDPAATGPFPAASSTLDIPATQAATLSTDVYWPGSPSAVDPGAGLCPALVLGHGFARSKAQFVDLGRHFASRGYVVLIPDFAGSDHARNGDDLAAMVDWVMARDGDAASPFFGRIDRAAIGATGHSAGGLAAIVAAARDPRIAALAAMDPVDSGGLGAASLAQVRVPSAFTWSEPSSCNASGSGELLYGLAGPIKRGIRIVGATHCDPEAPSNFLCSITCGAASAARQRAYRKYVTGWFEYWLRCDPSYEPWVFGSEVAADLAAGRITYDQAGPTVLSCPGSIPQVTRLLAVRAGGAIRFIWDPVTATPAVSEYRLYRSTARSFSSPVLDAASPTTTYLASGAVAAPGDRYFRVRAASPAGEGP